MFSVISLCMMSKEEIHFSVYFRLFNAFNKVFLLNYSLLNADLSVLSKEHSVSLAYLLSRRFNT